MDLQTSVFLLFVLFAEGHSLQCYQCRNRDDSCSSQIVETCHSESAKCMSSTSLLQSGGHTTTVRGKGCSADCPSGSLNYGIMRTVVACCETDLCNAQNTPDPRTMIPNGKKCYYCDEKSCLNIMSCSESEDGCITITPKNLKEKENGPEVISCCSGNLCNGAQSVTHSFLFLFCSLLSCILLH
ncbi:phospholipase A2 inhibitor CNF [Labeo rohita]|uniref:phospholipase A2 inhibitor CNF n=1 Tax=Labeo rohita TaxID=84645 RepID=UPI0021E2BC64|nr:phospholipase A2 inhibitor CNF [Labeo rohita]